MNWRTRIVEFPGGMLELRGYEDDSGDDDVGTGARLEVDGRSGEAEDSDEAEAS